MAERHEHLIIIDEIQQPFHDECCIYRVHEGLRRGKPTAYEPLVVSIGPYHCQNSRLQAMKKHKKWYFHKLLQRRNETEDKYILETKKLEDTVRRCYAEPIIPDQNEFVEMMLLDGCFIIEFFLGITHNPELNVGWINCGIRSDLMQLENQLPFFFISHLYEMTREDSEKKSLKEMAKLVLSEALPKSCLNSQYLDNYDSKEIKHLLHLVHVLCHPIKTPMTANGLKISNIIRGLVLLPVRIPFNAFLYLLILISLVMRTRVETRSEDDTQNQIYGAVELKEAGVKFNKVGTFDTDNANLFDIKFKDGLMEVPCFSVDDESDIFFRNLIAFEQHSRNVDTKIFTDYMDFMDQLISSEKDVELLRHAGIIQSFLGDDKEVSNLFNKLGDGVIVDSRNSFYYDVRVSVNRHCRKRRNRVLAKLRHNYFKNPWANISTLGAITLLGLTIAQTVGTYK